MIKSLKKIIYILFSFIFVFVLSCGNASNNTKIVESTNDPNRIINVGIAWKCNDKPSVYESTISALEMVGANPIVLEEVTTSKLSYAEDKTLSSTMTDDRGALITKAANIVISKPYESTNIDSIMENIDAVIFLGGEDISPTLYSGQDECNTTNISDSSLSSNNINATRDVSDYLLMSYCIDNNIPIMGICRGMQLLAIISGADVIEDIPTYYEKQGIEYNYSHRMLPDSTGNIPEYAVHNVDIVDTNSIIYDIVLSNTIKNVPSWHHQAVICEGLSEIKVTGTTTIGGITIDEIIERTDVSYAVGYQFHPEAVIEKKNKQSNYTDYTDINIVLRLFEDLVDNAR